MYFSILVKLFSLVLMTFFFTGCGNEKTLYFSAPNVLNNMSRAKNRPGFWVANHPSPDRLISDQRGIDRFNRHIMDDLKMVRDISFFPAEYDGVELRRELLDRFERIQERRLYLQDSSLASHSFFEQIEKNMGLDTLPSILPVTFGLTVGYVNQRRLPVTEPLYVQKRSSSFDKLQNNGLDIGIPLAILHESVDGKWYYGISSSSSGWVRVEDVGLCSRKTLSGFIHDPSFIVTTEAKSDIFFDESMSHYHDSVRMGSRFPLMNMRQNNITEVAIPSRRQDGRLVLRSGYMHASRVHSGYLSYTARNIINQAFALLHEPYGWGGMNGEQDCSRFIKEIFATVGITMPRNSKGQAKIGRMILEIDKNTSISRKVEVLQYSAVGGITLLFMPGHVMLFLGMVDEQPYVIHSTWGYRQKTFWGEGVRLLNRVVVSDLSLGRGSQKGSLIDRLTFIGVVSPQ